MGETRIYTQGLREHHVLKSSGAGHDWQQVVFWRLRSEHAKLGRGPSTARCEDGLGLQPSAYWYVARLEPDYAYVATLSTDALKPGGTGLACAFDTGGLWTDKITLVSPLSPAQKRELLARSAYAMDDYHPTMKAWLVEAYEPQALVNYTHGEKPKVHTVPEIQVADNARSWTWEVSIEVAADSDCFPPATSLHMTDRQYDQYETWVSRLRGLTNFDVYDHLDFVERILSIDTNPYEDATQSLIASATA